VPRSLGVIANRPEAARRLIKKLGEPSTLRVCYEAGPTGYVLYWQLQKLGVHDRNDRSLGGVNGYCCAPIAMGPDGNVGLRSPRAVKTKRTGRDVLASRLGSPQGWG
jgi:hypothetical protein